MWAICLNISECPKHFERVWADGQMTREGNSKTLRKMIAIGVALFLSGPVANTAGAETETGQLKGARASSGLFGPTLANLCQVTATARTWQLLA
jgi:hypothetical protein